MLQRARLSLVLLVLFVLSGIAGLIYQSIWSHYLGLTLGHAAYAQALVLGIFMGGMALGSWLASRWSLRLGHLVLAYAVVEAVIGVLGMVFHPLFLGYTELSQEVVLPALGSPQLAHVWQWGTAALLILPQCVLLGATFPLLSAGLIRNGDEADGQILGGLYFANSLGAAAGALLTTFLLLPAVGMPGSVLTAGVLNIIVALLAWAVWKMMRRAALPEATVRSSDVPARVSAPAERKRLSRVLLFAAAITGATSFIYEIGWVRMLNQVLGTTIHSFELMLAAFIFGLACGGLWIRFRGKTIRDPIEYAGLAQILMGVAALLSLAAFAQSFRWVSWLMQALARTDQGYTLFSLGGAIVSLLVMFPAAFFAGMTLPLFTVALLRNADGEGAIGRVYAANTLGAIAGVALMIHVLTPTMGVRLAVVLAALADAALGLYLIRCVSPKRRTVGYAVGAAATVGALVVGMLMGRIDPLQQVSGVFRTGDARVVDGNAVPFLRDGKTATVSVIELTGGAAAISTNGKPDAALGLDATQPPTADEVTMVMAGALPFVHHPKAERVAVIGWGSGLTTHTLAGSQTPELIETIEIEAAMYEGARLFGNRVQRAYSDPRSKLKVEDARTYFSTGNRKYDVIVSEPSNPWVSGVASLFTDEFYHFVRKHLTEDGVLVQWIHAYELNDRLFGTMVAALVGAFPESELYVTNTSDLIFVAHAGRRYGPNFQVLDSEPLAGELKRVGLGSPEQFALRRVGGPRVLATYVKHLGVLPYSDFYPVVSLNAPRSRFKRESADAMLMLVDNGLPVLDVLDGRSPPAVKESELSADSRFGERTRLAHRVVHALQTQDASDPRLGEGGVDLYLSSLLEMSSQRMSESQVDRWSRLAANVVDVSLGLLPSEQQRGAWIDPAWMPDQAEQPLLVQQLMAMYASAAGRDAAGMAATSRALLDSPDFNRLSVYAREQILVVAQLAAIAQGRTADVRAIDDRYGKGIALSPQLGYVRSFLLAWPKQEAVREADDMH